jgi:hypothetical protein
LALGGAFENEYRIGTGDRGVHSDVSAMRTCPDNWACGAGYPNIQAPVAARQYGGN